MIPRSFRVINQRIQIRVVPASELPGCIGEIDFDTGVILISEAQSPEVCRHTLWHEITHAMLNAINHTQKYDEAFVDTLAGMIVQVIDSMEGRQIFPPTNAIQKTIRTNKRPRCL